MATTKISVSLPTELVEQARAAAQGNLSAFVSRAVEDRLLIENGRRAVAAYEDEMGPIPEDLMAEVKAQWPRR